MVRTHVLLQMVLQLHLLCFPILHVLNCHGDHQHCPKYLDEQMVGWWKLGLDFQHLVSDGADSLELASNFRNPILPIKDEICQVLQCRNGLGIHTLLYGHALQLDYSTILGAN